MHTNGGRLGNIVGKPVCWSLAFTKSFEPNALRGCGGPKTNPRFTCLAVCSQLGHPCAARLAKSLQEKVPSGVCRHGSDHAIARAAEAIRRGVNHCQVPAGGRRTVGRLVSDKGSVL